ncbi:hypothetical protein CHUAL_005017 [Chamberlinius hualienensis]
MTLTENNRCDITFARVFKEYSSWLREHLNEVITKMKSVAFVAVFLLIFTLSVTSKKIQKRFIPLFSYIKEKDDCPMTSYYYWCSINRSECYADRDCGSSEKCCSVYGGGWYGIPRKCCLKVTSSKNCSEKEHQATETTRTTHTTRDDYLYRDIATALPFL